MRKITVAIDSFKGSLTSEEAAASVSEGVLSVFPGCEVAEVKIADGGEGTMAALSDALKGEKIDIVVTGPLLEPVKASYAISQDGKIAIMEMASAAGLPLVSMEKRNPLVTTTKGVGEMILNVINRGCRKVLIGLGGSATNDGGLGMLIALGYKFYDADNELIEIGTGADVERVARMDDANVADSVKETEFIVACDVRNPLYGPDGAARIFARQKGADDEMIDRLDKGLAYFAKVIPALGEVAMQSGAGAAGGLGAAFLAFLNARLKPGIELVLDAVNFDKIIEGSDLIITGEGKLDEQTCMGKAPAGVLRRGKAAGIPVIAIGGAVRDAEKLNGAGFTAVFSIQQSPTSLEESMRPDTARHNLRQTVTQLLRLLH